MLKINIGWSQERLAQQIAFGLSEGNLERLPTGPIAIKGQDLQVATNFLIFHTHQDTFQTDFETVLRLLQIEPQGKQPVLNLQESFYVAPVPTGNKICYFIGLHATSYQKLRNGENLTFRARMIEGEGQNVEINIFWGQTEEKMLEVLEILGYKKD